MYSLVMRNDGALYHNNERKTGYPANSLPQEGDVVVSFLVDLLSTVKVIQQAAFSISSCAWEFNGPNSEHGDWISNEVVGFPKRALDVDACCLT